MIYCGSPSEKPEQKRGRGVGAWGRELGPLVLPPDGFRGQVDTHPRITRPGLKTGLVPGLCVAAPS